LKPCRKAGFFYGDILGSNLGAFLFQNAGKIAQLLTKRIEVLSKCLSLVSDIKQSYFK